MTPGLLARTPPDAFDMGTVYASTPGSVDVGFMPPTTPMLVVGVYLEGVAIVLWKRRLVIVERDQVTCVCPAAYSMAWQSANEP
jgi:hypothetical protein